MEFLHVARRKTEGYLKITRGMTTTPHAEKLKGISRRLGERREKNRNCLIELIHRGE
ncbi:MAG: hypothetical protein RLZZ408_93 [Verrucomicrobiota bacterium]|jgi:hypothetical protein